MGLIPMLLLLFSACSDTASHGTATEPGPVAGKSASDGQVPQGSTAVARSTQGRSGTSRAVLTSAGCPQEMARVHGFCIDRWETTAEGTLGDKDQAIASPAHKTTAVAHSNPGVLPTTGVSWYQAMAICKNAGKHLCTVDEWRRACSAGSAYPWGDAPDPITRCAVVSQEKGQVVHVLQKTGAMPECVTPEGVYDMLGNAWEWVDPQTNGPDGRLASAKMGGAFYSGHDPRCPNGPFMHHPPEFDGTIVARCCLELDPGQ